MAKQYIDVLIDGKVYSLGGMMERIDAAIAVSFGLQNTQLV